MSLPEVMLWKHLRGRGDGKPVFRRQHPLGPYVLDFYCPAARLCFEIDGESHGFGDQPQRDARRDGYLRHHGIRTIRLSASDAIAEAYGVAQWVIEQVEAIVPQPPPQAGEVFGAF